MAVRTIPPDRPVDPVTIEILREVASVATHQHVDHMLVGATARDVLLTHVFGLPVTRATRDVDFAVAVKDWDQFNEMRARLTKGGMFREEGGIQHRLYFNDTHGIGAYHIDLVPFGAISNNKNEVEWPPDLQTIMNVAGFEDALTAAELVEFEAGFVQKVVSIPGLAILKIVAWSDRGGEHSKHAQDLMWLLQSYAGAGNHDRVYDVEGVIEAGDYNPDLAGGYLLGLDMRRMVSEDTLNQIRRVLNEDFDKLVTEMMKTQRHAENVEERVITYLGLLLQGLR